jgi:hypothetical protein
MPRAGGQGYQRTQRGMWLAAEWIKLAQSAEERHTDFNLRFDTAASDGNIRTWRRPGGCTLAAARASERRFRGLVFGGNPIPCLNPVARVAELRHAFDCAGRPRANRLSRAQ